MRLSDIDLVQKLLTSNRNFTWNWFTLQGDEAGKLAFFYVCVFNVFPYETNAANLTKSDPMISAVIRCVCNTIASWDSLK